MSKIVKAFENKKAFIPFISGGAPDLDTTKELIIEMEKAGADIIEIGIPFSDPITEGTVIQAANERALSGGCTTDKLFDAIKEAGKTVKIPMVFFTYINPIYTYGIEKFLDRCNECGIKGLVVPDLPFEEKDEIAGSCKEHDVELISSVVFTDYNRIKMIAEKAEGFILCETVIGENSVGISENIENMIYNIRKVTDIPYVTECENPSLEQIKNVAKYCDGVIVRSAIVKLEEKYGKDSPKYVREYVKQMKDAIN